MTNIPTSESVSEGHPDKLCDRISDSILDFFLAEDPTARIACETAAFNDTLIIGGEITADKNYTSDDIEQIARAAVKDIGYIDGAFGYDNFEFINKLNVQSPDIAQGVDEGTGTDKEEGAGDQGIMFGYACKETDTLMPAPIYYSHLLVRELTRLRKNGTYDMLMPDMKSQLTLRYEGVIPVGVNEVVLSTQHKEGLSHQDVYDIVKPFIIDTLPNGWVNDTTKFHINPTGKFVIGGPVGDAGLTGRKIIVDTYGGAAPHGGGAFSGKDPTKVDRSAAYAARYLAKNVVAGGLAERCTIQLSYAIGVSRPISVHVDTHNTGSVDEVALSKSIQKSFDLTPKGIRTHLQLNKPIYTPTSAYGHFGRTPTDQGHFSWEKTDLIESLKSNL